MISSWMEGQSHLLSEMSQMLVRLDILLFWSIKDMKVYVVGLWLWLARFKRKVGERGQCAGGIGKSSD